MIELFKKQSTFVKVLIIAVVVVVIGFIVQQIYKRFIKNAILREAYEDIKIIIESSCPAGYYFDGLSCVGCDAPKAVSGTGNGCDNCKKDAGFTVVTPGNNPLNGVPLGSSCSLPSTGQVPDPNNTSTGYNLITNAVTPIVTNTSNSTLSLISTSGTYTPAGGYNQVLFNIGANNFTDSFVADNTYDPPNNKYERKGTRNTTFTINGIYLAPQVGIPINFSTLYENVSVTNITNFTPFLFTNCKQKLQDLFFTALFGTTTPKNPPEIYWNNISFKDNQGNSYTLSTLTNMLNVTSPTGGLRLSTVTVPTSYNCGKEIISIQSNACDTNNQMTANVTYDIANASNLNYYPNWFNSPGFCVVNNPITNAKCTIGTKPCEVSSLTPSYTPAYPKYDPATGYYSYTDTYSYIITQYPNGTGATACSELNYKNESGQTLSFNALNEFSINNNLSQAIIKRTCVINYKNSSIALAYPNNPGNPSDYNAPYMNPSWTPNNTTNIAYVLYKAPSSLISSTNSSTSPSCNYSNASLPVLSLYGGTYTPTSASESYDTVNNKRITVLNAKRNVYESFTTDSSGTSSLKPPPPNISSLLTQALNGLNIVATSAQISAISFMGAQYTINDYTSNKNIAKTTVTSTQALTTTTVTQLSPSRITFDSNLSTSNTYSFVSCGGTSVSTKNYIVSRVNAQNNGGKVYTINASIPSTINTATFNGIASNKAFAWLSNDRSNLYNGDTLTAIVQNEDVYRSYNGGKNWYGSNFVTSGTPETSVFNNGIGGSDLNFSEVCMSADGVIQYVITFGGFIYYSVDSGYTWTKYVYSGTNTELTNIFNSPQNWSAIVCSSDGLTVTAAIGASAAGTSNIGGSIYTATVTPSATTPATSTFAATNIAVPSNLTLTKRNNISNSSFTWTKPNGNNVATSSTFIVNNTPKNWKQVSMSSDGKYQTAVIQNGLLATSSDSGVTWSFSNIIVNNVNNIDTIRNWTDIKVSPYIPTNAPSGSKPGKYQVAIESLPTTANYGTIPVGDPDSIGVYYSKDYGFTWTPVLSTTNNAISNPYTNVNVDIDYNNIAYITTTSGIIQTVAIPL